MLEKDACFFVFTTKRHDCIHEKANKAINKNEKTVQRRCLPNGFHIITFKRIAKKKLV